MKHEDYWNSYYHFRITLTHQKGVTSEYYLEIEAGSSEGAMDMVDTLFKNSSDVRYEWIGSRSEIRHSQR